MSTNTQFNKVMRSFYGVITLLVKQKEQMSLSPKNIAWDIFKAYAVFCVPVKVKIEKIKQKSFRREHIFQILIYHHNLLHL